LPSEAGCVVSFNLVKRKLKQIARRAELPNTKPTPFG
jgi:hypothetical protein